MRRLLLLLLACLPAALCAQEGGYSLRFKLSERNFADSIDIEYDEGRVFVPVTVGGCRRRFLLDTGAAQAIVYADTDLAQSPPRGSVRSVDALGEERRVPMVTLPPLTIGRLTLTGLPATVHQRPQLRQRIDGVIGFDLVCKKLLMKIDVARRQLILTDRKKHFQGDPVGFEIPYEVLPYRHTPYIQVSPWRGYTEQVLFDTGSPFLYLINRDSFDRGADSLLARNPAQVERRVQASHLQGLHGKEATSEVVHLRLDSLSIGAFVLRDVLTHTTRGFSHIGGPILERGSVLFLPHTRRLRILPISLH